jgi:hypothetical protein
MIILYPDRHVRALNVDALVKRATRGELYLLLEDGNVASHFVQFADTEFISSLELERQMSLDVILACLVMAVDAPHETIGEMEPQAGFILYCILVFVLATDPECDVEALRPVVTELGPMLPTLQSMPDVYRAVKEVSDRVLGGVPRSVRLSDAKSVAHAAIARRTGMDPEQHMVYYNFILREKAMAARILEVAAKYPTLDVHVVLGACHVTGDLSNEFISSLNVNVPSYVDLTNLIERHYPNQRLVNLIGEHAVR